MGGGEPRGLLGHFRAGGQRLLDERVDRRIRGNEGEGHQLGVARAQLDPGIELEHVGQPDPSHALLLTCLPEHEGNVPGLRSHLQLLPTQGEPDSHRAVELLLVLPRDPQRLLRHRDRGLGAREVEVGLGGGQYGLRALGLEAVRGGRRQRAGLARAVESAADIGLGGEAAARGVAPLVDLHEVAGRVLQQVVVAAVGQRRSQPGEELLDGGPVDGPGLFQPLGRDLDVQVLRAREAEHGGQVDGARCRRLRCRGEGRRRGRSIAAAHEQDEHERAEGTPAGGPHRASTARTACPSTSPCLPETTTADWGMRPARTSTVTPSSWPVFTATLRARPSTTAKT